jgi:hypothetical protein
MASHDAVQSHELQIVLVRAYAHVRHPCHGLGQRRLVGDEKGRGGLAEIHARSPALRVPAVNPGAAWKS